MPQRIATRSSIPIFLMMMVAVISWMGCAKKIAENPKEKPLVSVIVGKPVVMPIVEWDEYIGRLAPIESVDVRSRVSGYLTTTAFEEGKLVRVGEVIATIDQRPFAAEVLRNEANLSAAHALFAQSETMVAQSKAEEKRAMIRRDLAKKQLERNQELRSKNTNTLQELEISEADFEIAQAEVVVAESKVDASRATLEGAKAAVSIAQANLDLARLNLQYTQIRAPIDGRISRRYITEGNFVSGGTNDSTLLTTIVSLDPIHCYFDADEQTFLKYLTLEREGRRVSSRNARNPVYLALANERVGFPHLGQMDFVDNRMDEETGTIRGRAILPNPELDLVPGLFARVRLPGSPRYDAVLIPDKAIGTDQAEKFVLTVDESNKVIRKLVTLGPISHGLRIIRSGLEGKERVILGGLQRARPGNEVAVSEKEEVVSPGPEPLPDEYQPVPEEEWLRPKRIPAGNVVIPQEFSEANIAPPPATTTSGTQP